MGRISDGAAVTPFGCTEHQTWYPALAMPALRIDLAEEVELYGWQWVVREAGRLACPRCVPYCVTSETPILAA